MTHCTPLTFILPALGKQLLSSNSTHPTNNHSICFRGGFGHEATSRKGKRPCPGRLYSAARQTRAVSVTSVNGRVRSRSRGMVSRGAERRPTGTGKLPPRR